MAKRAIVTGWKLPDVEREMLLQCFPPKYENVIADHVTLGVHDWRHAPLPQKPEDSKVVGHADDGQGLECLVVSLDGSTERPDGSSYHITWSLGARRRARESNDVLRDRGWNELDLPIPIQLIPASF